MIGENISYYKIVKKIGEGGMGVVYQAEDTRLERTVALKFLAPHLLCDAEGRKRFEREAKAAAKLDHPNICTVYEIGEENGRTFIVMAFLEGLPLSKKISEKPLKLDELLAVATQIAVGLDATHAKGVVHRDIKPDNIMLLKGSRGLVKIMDFGVAQLAGSSRLTRGDSTLGTMAYMSPEQTEGTLVDQRTDIWALGVVLYEMISGRTPFRGEFDQAVIYSILNEEPEPLTAVRTDVPKALEQIVSKCMAKDPASRYQHADEIAVDLRRLQSEIESAQSPTAAPASAPEASRMGRRLGAAAIMAAVLAGAWFGLLSPGPEQPAGPMRVTPLTSYPGEEDHPDFSPDGMQVVFTWNGENQDNWDIYFQPIVSAAPVRLTTDPALDHSPAWSPDGRTIAFLRGGPDQSMDVLLIPAIGGPERKVTEVSAFSSYVYRARLAWLPDGSGLVLSDSARNGSRALFIASIETGEKRQITESQSGSHADLSPALSADGRKLAFVRWAEQTDLYLVDLAEDFTLQGAAKRLRLPSSAGRIISTVWSPDETGLIAGEDSGSENERLLWAPIAAPESVYPLVLAGLGSRWAAVSATTNRLVFSRRTLDTNIGALSRTGANGAEWRPVAFPSTTRVEYNPQYSPDGSWVAFESNRGGSGGVWTSRADGSNAALLYAKDASHSGSPRWSFDGQRIAFDSTVPGNSDIYVISAVGGSPLQITDHAATDATPGWSADSNWIYFSSDRSGRSEVWKVSAAGGVPEQITRNGGSVSYESPDGRLLYFLKSDHLPALELVDLWKVPVEGGEETLVIEDVFCRNFTATENGVYFMTLTEPEPTNHKYSVHFLDFAASQVEKLADLPAVTGYYGLTVSPDERTILYATRETIGADLILIENFR